MADQSAAAQAPPLTRTTSHSHKQPSPHHHHHYHSRSRSRKINILAQATGEEEPLIRHTSHLEPESQPMYCCLADQPTLKDLPIYTNIHRIRRDIVSIVEDYLSLEQLRDVRINISVVRPLVDKLYEMDDISTVYCLLVNRVQFLQEQSHLRNRQNVNFTRATLCELIATRILRRFDEDNPGPSGLLVLAHILVAGFQPFQGAPESIKKDNSTWSHRKTLPALEVAIVSESKLLLSSTSCQKVIDGIFEGRIIFTPSSFLDLIPDRYKQKPISLYDPRAASMLNQYRLIVPRTRNILEIVQFLILLVLYLGFMAERDASYLSWLELAFSVYTFGWVLDQFATILEHGWHVYTQNLWSFLDVTFGVIYWIYLILRVHGWRTGSLGPAQQALDVLAIGAPVLVPRLAFNLLSNNLLFVSLRAMMADFSVLTALAVWCFGGFLLSLYWLGEGEFPPLTLAMWMLWIWFGLDGTGVRVAPEFHWFLGPALMVTFAFLGNTLFLTILVSMLSNTFSTIVSNATAEIQFRHAVLTLEGVKSDAIFAYQPPFNILALFVLVPLKFVVSPRWFHKIHVTAVRFLNLPLLLIIGAFERRSLWTDTEAKVPGFETTTPRKKRIGWFWEKWRITTHGDIFAVFDTDPPDELEEDIAVDDELTHHMIRRQYTRSHTADVLQTMRMKKQGELKNGSQGKEQQQQQQSQRPAPQQQQQQPTFLGNRSKSHSRESSKDRPIILAPSLSRTVSGVGVGSSSKPGSRRDSMAPFPGLRQEIRGILDDSEAVSNLTGRLESLETSMARIESMLGVLVGESTTSSFGGEEGEDEGEKAGDEDDDDDDDDDADGSILDHAVESEEEDVRDGEVLGRTGTLQDLDRSADER